jgi:glutathione S-transferase
MMIKLCGFAVSNYYNKVKLALLEKGVAFEEVESFPAKSDHFLARSPMGKVPFAEVDGVPVAESQVLLEYLEDAYPAPALYPRDALQRAKCRELIAFIELHLELPARTLFPQAFFGASVSDEVKARAARNLAKGAAAFNRLAKFSPFVAGSEFTYADCAAYFHLPVISRASKAVLGADVLAPIAPVRGYIEMLKPRPHIQRIDADRAAGVQRFQEYISKTKDG